MAYERLNLKNGSVVDESSISHIEDGIVQNEEDIATNAENITQKADQTDFDDLSEKVDELNTSLAKLTDPLYFNSVAEIVDYVDNSLDMYQIVFCHISGSAMGELGGVSGLSKGIIAKSRNVTGSFDFACLVTYGTNIYVGRYDNGTINLRSIASTTVSTTSVEPENA